MNNVVALFVLSILLTVSAKNLVSKDLSQIQFTQVKPLSPSFDNYLPSHSSQGRIIGGNEAIPYSIPYQVLMLVGNSQTLFYCGGSLISTNYVLTSADCLYEAAWAEVMLGAHNFTETAEHQVNIMAGKLIIHEEWGPNNLVNNIALLRLSNPAPINEYIQIIKLPKYSDFGNSFEGEVSKISGWGKAKNEDNFLSWALRYVDVPVMNNFECGLIYLDLITDSNICTVGDGGKGFCMGDSGGPLVHNNVQIGVVSFIYWNFCESGYPSVYTRLTSYLEWIAKNSDVVIEA